MRRSTRLTRALTRVTILLQLLLPTVVSIADARLERDAMTARAYSHVESNTGEDCVRIHRADCALCQHLTAPLAKSAKAAPPVYVSRCTLFPIVVEPGRVTARDQRPSLPRAPPSA